MTDYEPGRQETDESNKIDERDVRALQQYLTVLEDQRRVRGYDDLYEVVSASGKSYLVDAHEGTCECSDHEHRGAHCKHAPSRVRDRRPPHPGRRRSKPR